MVWHVIRTMQYCAATFGSFTLRCTKVNIVKTSETNMRPNKPMGVYGVVCCIQCKNDAILRRYFRKLYFPLHNCQDKQNEREAVFMVWRVIRTMQYCAASFGSFTFRCIIVKTSETNVRPSKHNCVYGVAVLHERRSIAPLFPKTILYTAKRT